MMISDSSTDDESKELPELLSKASVCRLLDNVTAKHVENLVRSGRMPSPVYLGRSPRWRRRELNDWIEAGCPVLDAAKLKQWKNSRADRN